MRCGRGDAERDQRRDDRGHRDEIRGGDRQRQTEHPEHEGRNDERRHEVPEAKGQDEARDLEAEARLQEDPNRDAGDRCCRTDGQDLLRPGRERLHELARVERGLAPDVGDQYRDDDRPEHRGDGREARDEEGDDREERRVLIPVALREVPEAGRVERDGARAEPARIDLDREEDPEVVEDRRHHRHDHDLQVADSEDLGHEERRRSQHRR